MTAMSAATPMMRWRTRVGRGLSRGLGRLAIPLLYQLARRRARPQGGPAMSSSTEEVRARLEAAWRRLLLPFAVAEAVSAAAFADLVSRYSEPPRHYHNLDHLADVLGTIDGLADE